MKVQERLTPVAALTQGLELEGGQRVELRSWTEIAGLA
jgi:hypothetical protein